MDVKIIIGTIVDLIWSNVFIAICLLAGLFFSVMTRFVQLRMIREMVRLIFDKSENKKLGISSFQAFTMSLAGRVGVGNIVGVGTAIYMGGPGAVFWM